MPNETERTLHCTEVWGGNRRVEQTVILPGLDAWVTSLPCGSAAAGGDVHYVSACAAGQVVRVLVADVSGHGSAVAETANTLRKLMRRLVNDHDQQRLVGDLNREFTAAAAVGVGDSTEFRFATAIALTFDSYSKQVLVCNAGHPPPLWYRASEQRWTTLEPDMPDAGRNLPVGVEEGIKFEQFELTLQSDDLILCHTDSLIEAHDGDGNQLDTAGLLKLVESMDVREVDRLLPDLLAKLDRLSPQNLTRDDVTGLLLRVNRSVPAVPFMDRLLAPARAVAGLVGVHFPNLPRR